VGRCDPGCPLCYSNVRARSNYKGHVGYRPVRAEVRLTMSQYIRKEQAPKGPGGAQGKVVPPEDIVSRFPALWEYLSLDRWEDGKKREVSSLTLFWGDGRLKAALNDKANGRVLFSAGTSLSDLLVSLEAALVSGDAEWKVSAAGRPRKG